MSTHFEGAKELFKFELCSSPAHRVFVARPQPDAAQRADSDEDAQQPHRDATAEQGDEQENIARIVHMDPEDQAAAQRAVREWSEYIQSCVMKRRMSQRKPTASCSLGMRSLEC